MFRCILPDVAEEEVLKVKNDLLALSEVKMSRMFPRDEELTRFKEKHKDDPVVLQALEEIDENPLEASLNVKAKDPGISRSGKLLEGDQYKDLYQ